MNRFFAPRPVVAEFLPLPPSERVPAFEKRDFVTVALLALGCGY